MKHTAKTPKIGDRVTVAYPCTVSYGYVRATDQIEGNRGPLHVYFPEIKQTGTGWFARDFNEYR